MTAMETFTLQGGLHQREINLFFLGYDTLLLLKFEVIMAKSLQKMPK